MAKEHTAEEERRIRREGEPVLTRDEFVNSFRRAYGINDKRGEFYDYYVALRKEKKLFCLKDAIARFHVTDQVMRGWVDLIVGLRTAPRRKVSYTQKYRAPDYVFTEEDRDIFINGRTSKLGKRITNNLQETAPQRAQFFDWFVANRNNPDRAQFYAIADEIGVPAERVLRWSVALGGFNVQCRTKNVSCRVQSAFKEMEYMKRIIAVLEKRTTPISVLELRRQADVMRWNYDNFVAVLQGTEYEYLLERIITKRAIESRSYNDIIDYINYFEEKNGRAPTISELRAQNFGREKKVYQRALEDRTKISISKREARALEWKELLDERAFAETVTAAPYERDEDWLARVEDEGWKGFLFTGGYWERYRALWAKKRQRALKRTESLIKREIQFGRDPLEVQCYGPKPEEQKPSPICELYYRIKTGRSL